jgi:hypothetical protein
MALKTLQCCGDASLPEQRSALRAKHTLNPPPPIHPQAQRVVTHPFDASAQAQGLMWGARGSFPPAAAMAMTVVMPVMYCAKATEILKNEKINKISCFIGYFYLKLYIVKHITVSLLLNLEAAQRGRSVLFSDEQKLLFEGGKKGFVKNTKLV